MRYSRRSATEDNTSEDVVVIVKPIQSTAYETSISGTIREG